MAGFLVFLFIRLFIFYSTRPVYTDGQQLSFQSALQSQPTSSGNSLRITLNTPDNQKVFVTASSALDISYGDTVRVSGVLKKKLLNGENAILTMSFPKIEKIASEKNMFSSSVFKLRSSLIELFEKALPQTSASLLLGIVFGIKEDMPKTFKDDLRISGVYHVIAASGMNITMVAAFLCGILSVFLKRQQALIASIFGILLYASLTGFEAPILRASLMGILAFSGQILGRQTTASYSLFLAAWIMLMVSPELLEQVSFQLSFVSTIGLVYLRPLLIGGERFKKMIDRSVLGEDAVTTIAAQLATLPILLLYFGTYSLWSILVNLLVLWTVPLLMVLGGIAAIVGMIFQPLAYVFLYLCLPLLVYFQMIASFFSHLKGTLQVDSLPLSFIIGYYFILISLIVFWKRNLAAQQLQDINE